MLEEIHRRHPLLSSAGWGFVLLAVLLSLAIPLDGRTVLGLNVWVKPLKFALSLAIFLWTMGWLIYDLRLNYRHRTLLALAFILFSVVEQLAITGQAARGVTSHFNVSTGFDGMVFSVMGIAIGLNTLVVGIVTFLFFYKKLALSGPYLWGARMGLLLFMVGSIEGTLIVQNFAHTVGAPDGGPGIPFLNWSTDHGDLRVAHFLGLHGLQILLILGGLLSQFETPTRKLSFVMVLIALGYAALTFLLFLQARQGLPFVD